jgi:predicted O-methyltransferase YrrM
VSILRKILDRAGPIATPFRGVPDKVLRYESLYDRTTGGYRVDPSAPAPDYGSVEVEVGRLWYALVMMLRPHRVLETGTHRGYSTTCIASALRDLHAVDGGERTLTTIDPASYDHLWEGTDVARFIRWVPKTSFDAASEFKGQSFDLLVLDSDHHYDTIIFELMAFEPLLKERGTILLHDSLYFDGVGAAVQQIRQNPRFDCVTLPTPRVHENPPRRCPGITIVSKHKDGEPRLAFDERFRGWNTGDTVTTPYLWQDPRVR